MYIRILNIFYSPLTAYNSTKPHSIAEREIAVSKRYVRYTVYIKTSGKFLQYFISSRDRLENAYGSNTRDASICIQEDYRNLLQNESGKQNSRIANGTEVYTYLYV